MRNIFSKAPTPIHKASYLAFFLLFFYTIQAQTLEIHQISVGQGDAGLIVVRDTALLRTALRTNPNIVIPDNRLLWLKLARDSNVVLSGTIKKIVLIDAGKGAEQAKKIKDYLTKIGADSLDYTILSHYHDDHYGGFRQLFKDGWLPKLAAYDRGEEGKSPKPGTNTFSGYINILHDNGIMRMAARADVTDINLGTLGGNNIQLTCVISNGYTMGMDPDDMNEWPGGNDQNDYSVGWILQCGAFRFYTGGDLNGSNLPFEIRLGDSLLTHDPADFTSFTNVAMGKGHVCSMKLNHHGGDESTHPYFLARLRPSTVLISSGYHKSYCHPRVAVLMDLDSKVQATWDLDTIRGLGEHPAISIQQYYITAMMDTTSVWDVMEGYSPQDQDVYKNVGDPALSNGIISGDVVVIVDDANIATESKYLVYWDGEKSTAVNTGAIREPNAAGTHYFQCHKATNLHYITNH